MLDGNAVLNDSGNGSEKGSELDAKKSKLDAKKGKLDVKPNQTN